jgi:hypothetical protein
MYANPRTRIGEETNDLVQCALPHLGVFAQPDPLGYQDDPNLYAYAGDDPVNFDDPTGMLREIRYCFSTGGPAASGPGGEIIVRNQCLTIWVWDQSDWDRLFPRRENFRPTEIGGSIRQGLSRVVKAVQQKVCQALQKLPPGTALSLGADAQSYGGLGGYLGYSAFVDRNGNTGFNISRGWGAGFGLLAGAGVAWGTAPTPGRAEIGHIQGGIGVGYGGGSASYSAREGWGGSAGISAGPKLGYAFGSVSGTSSTTAGRNICR